MSNPEKNDQQKSKPGSSILLHLKRIFLHDWGWKLGCLVAALFLWGALISQDATLSRSKVFTDVTINVLNEDTLLRNGYIVVSGLEPSELSGVRMRVEVPQRMYDTAQASNYNARVDLSRIRGTGKQTLQVLTTNSTTYGSVADLSVPTIEVEVEEYITRSRIPVRIAATGKAPENLYAAAATADPIYVEITGPKSLVDQVVRCVVPYDLSELSHQAGTERTALPFRLEDRQENEVPQELIFVSPLSSGIQIDTITVEQVFYEMVSLPVDMSTLLTGTPAAGYHVESIHLDPSQVRAAFSEQTNLTDLGSIHVSAPVDISGLSESKAFSVPLLRPADAKYLGISAVTVTVEIAADAAPAAEDGPAAPAGEEGGA